MNTEFGAPVAHPYEKWWLRRFAHRLFESETRRGKRRPRATIARWLTENRALIGGRRYPSKLLAEESGRIDCATCAALAPARERLALAGRESAPAPSSLERRIDALADLLSLAPQDRALFSALARSVLSRPLRDLIQRLEGSDGDCWFEDETSVGALSLLLATPPRRLWPRLQSTAPLILYGLVRDCGREEVELTPMALSILRQNANDAASLRRRLLGPMEKATLRWEDFAHVEGRDIAERLLSAALENGARGVNILLYGSHGAGKTEFARTLGKKLGALAIFAGQTRAGNENHEPSRVSRMADVALRRTIAREIGRAIVVVDEADDIFSGADAPGPWRRGSKVFTNRLVERSETPTLWIVNEPDLLGPAILRRMTYALRFPASNRAVRARIIDRLARRQRLHLKDEDRRALASLDAAPAIVAHALRAAELAGDGAAALHCARASLRALNGAAPAPSPQPIAYDATLLCADVDLAALRDRITRADTLAISFLFHGPPGTGKSAYARHLAEALGLDTIERRASDLFSKWVGDTEKLIRESFEEAADRRAFLIFDEADSLLASRVGAQHSWEVTQVNEMLVCMERHPLPFACTTNTFESLDSASLRRFLFKAKFLPMTRAQIAAAFVKAFGAPAPAEILTLDNLTPGDFAVVARKARALRETNAKAVARWLEEESQAKPGARRGRIGF